MTDNAPKHPGRTPAQRRVLDAIGCGNNSPRMVAAVRDAMLKAGLIVEIEPRLIFGRGSSPIDRIPVKVSRYEMPIHVHMQWCSAVAVESGGEGA
jgi:hypothetical protein